MSKTRRPSRIGEKKENKCRDTYILTLMDICIIKSRCHQTKILPKLLKDIKFFALRYTTEKVPKKKKPRLAADY